MNAAQPGPGPIVEFIAKQPGMIVKLLTEHADDGTGHCRACSAGPQAGRKVWPCPLHGYAMLASQQYEQRR